MSNKSKLVITGKRIKLVYFSKKYLNNPNYLKWLRDYEVIKYINRPEYVESVTSEDIKAYVERLEKSENDIFFAIVTADGNEFIGTFKICYIDWYTKRAELGIMVGDKDYWGKGIATEAFSIAINFLFNKLNFHKIVGGCMESNIGMRKVFEKLGFKEEGHFREQDFFEDKYTGHFHYGLLKEEYINPEKD